MNARRGLATPWFRDRVALAIAIPTFLLHLALANRYDVFRDELYFIVCGRHPAFGYVDQPPLVPLLAAGFYALGHQTWLLRLPVVFAAAALVILTVRFARLLGGGDGAGVAAGIAAAVAPILLGISATFNSSVFEPLAWTAVAFGLARAVLLDDRRALVWSGLVAGVALEAKYALSSWLVALLVGVVVTNERRLLGRRELWIGLGLATLIALPSFAWQAANGWPFVELVAAAGAKNASITPVGFMLAQLVVLNPLFAPLWIGGLAAPFVCRDLAPLRFVAIAYVVVAALIIAGHGKDYYLTAAYPPLFALGGVALERVVRSVFARAIYLALAVTVSAIVAPTALPILPPSQIAGYMQRIHLAPPQQEKAFAGTALPQEFADQLGWRTFVSQVGTAYASLPSDLRADTVVLVDNYGEAAALDVYGAPYGLPPALSGHNQYYLWNLRGQVGTNVLRVERNPTRLRPYCAGVRVLARTFAPYAMRYENGKSIAFCRRLKPRLATLWPKLKDYN
ncbi:MAG: glycosyltransferase family 39 protein [Candidatus Elarobacter sp.]